MAILLDTDIGTNIDDALALAYLLKRPDCELVGITTVSGEAERRAMLADAVCRACGRPDIPVHPGREEPTILPQFQPVAEQASILPAWPHETTFARNAAIAFLGDAIRSRPGELTLLSIGPLTNVGVLFAVDPEIPSLLKAHVMMGGLYGGPVAGRGPTERNIANDPHAAEVVFDARDTRLTCVGLDVTMRCSLAEATCRQRLSTVSVGLLNALADVWFAEHAEITFHDALAAAVLFEPSLCTYTRGRVRVEADNVGSLGRTQFDTASNAQPHAVATDVHVARFFEHFFSILEG
ncbi:MAG: nucleoside hydrolase [Phycisphaerae bacterium]|nr:nucleoside hydrolase [Phycisphaerae bacterium]